MNTKSMQELKIHNFNKQGNNRQTIKKQKRRLNRKPNKVKRHS